MDSAQDTQCFDTFVGGWKTCSETASYYGRISQQIGFVTDCKNTLKGHYMEQEERLSKNT